MPASDDDTVSQEGFQEDSREFDPLTFDPRGKDSQGSARMSNAVPKKGKVGRPRKGQEPFKGGYQAVWAPQKRADGSPGPQYALLACPYKEIFFGGARGGGKAIHILDKVLTPLGFKLMRDVTVGDVISAPDGETAEVIGVYPQGMQPVVRVTLRNGASVRASLDHLWLVRIARSDPKIAVTSNMMTVLNQGWTVEIPVGSASNWVKVDSIEDEGEGETQCIKVDRPDGLFLTNDGIVTHNTDGAIGVWLEHAARYGANARGMFLRRQYKQLEDVQLRCSMLFPKLGATFHKGDGAWMFPNGAILKLGHLWDEAATNAYQGHQYCVAEGTPVLMGDGTYLPIENVSVGDLVMTLEGPKPVLATMKPRLSPCVQVQVFDETGQKLGEQIHPEDHLVLTSVSAQPSNRYETFPVSAMLPSCHVFGPKQEFHLSAGPGSAAHDILDCHERPTGPVPYKSLGDWSEKPCRQKGCPSPWQSYTTLLDAHLENQESDAFEEDGRTCCKVSVDGLRGLQPPPELSVPVVLHGPSRPSGPLDWRASIQSGGNRKSTGSCSETVAATTSLRSDRQPLSEPTLRFPDYSGQSPVCDVSCAQTVIRTAPDSQCHCSQHHHRGDEQLLPLSKTCPDGVPCEAGVVERNRQGSPWDDEERTQEYSHLDEGKYVHPYTGQQRRVHQPYRFGRAVFRPCEPHIVHDLTIADANHYITDSHLVNCNSLLLVEELTQWPTPAPIDMMRGVLRSANGVPTKLIMTGNPGGSGHGWVKDRYVSPAPGGYTPIKDPKTGAVRIYIPSRVTDNTILMKNDPNYINNLKMAGSDTLVRAWLEGDWNIVAGGFFSDILDPDKHFIRPFDIPDSWRYRRSFDWGSAAPASLGIWAISDGNPVPDLDGFTFPRGSLIRVREWYTVASKDDGSLLPNQGQRLTNLALGNGIGQRSLKYNFSGCVADPSIFAKLGRESIYDEIKKGAAEVGHNLVFSPADNNRVAGWQRMRDMLENAIPARPEKPGLWIFDTCKHWIRTVPVLQRDETKPDDLDTAQEDHCLHGDTLVETDSGPRPIRDLVGTVGMVCQADGSWKAYRDCRLTRRNAETVRVTVSDGRSVTCTPDHRILTGRGWVEARHVHGDVIVCVGDTDGVAGLVTTIADAGSHDVYNLEVDDGHAFAVNGGLIVHNCADETRYAVQTGVRSMVVGDLSGR